MRYRYSRWDGSQEPFDASLEIGSLLDQISDDLLAGLSPRDAMRRLRERGLRRASGGLKDLRERLQRRRREAASRLNLDGPLGELREKLDDIIEDERGSLSSMQGETARQRETFLDLLPQDPARAMKELTDYRFTSETAQEKFDELLQQVQKQVMDALFQGITGAMGSMTPQDIARMRAMISELNDMIDKDRRGEPYDFEGFMSRYGDMFPENPRSLQELLEVLARRMAAMSRLMSSLSAEQRRQLRDLYDSVMMDLDIAWQMSQLDEELRRLMPELPWDEPVWGDGSDPQDLAGALGAIEALSDLDELEEALEQDYPGASMDDIDEEQLRAALDDDAVRDLRALKEIEKALEEAGIFMSERGDTKLTGRGARMIGERALVKVFEDLRRVRPGAHASIDSSGASEPTGSTRPWRFGDEGQIAVQKSIFNAVLRKASEGASTTSVKMNGEDFELIEAESRTTTATALLLDLSFSMPLRGHWVPAKRMALALHALIEGKYPQDALYLIGFSDWARRLEPNDLLRSGPIERVYGTNMHHAFMLAGRLLAEHPRATKQVIMVTDGEPTAHLTDDLTDSVFSWPPIPETIHKTLAEAMRLAASGVTLNIFMLEDDLGLTRFTSELARRTGGRVFQASSDEIGRYVISDFVRRR